MNEELIEMEKTFFIGLNHKGSISENAEEFEDEVNNLWLELSNFCEEKWDLIDDDIVNPQFSYEIQIWKPEDLEENGTLDVFAGLEVEDLNSIPLQFTGKVLSAGKYLKFTLEGEEIHGWEEFILQEWLPDSEYWLRSFDDYVFHVQRFHEEKFKGIENIAESELDILLPVEKVEEELKE